MPLPAKQRRSKYNGLLRARDVYDYHNSDDTEREPKRKLLLGGDVQRPLSSEPKQRHALQRSRANELVRQLLSLLPTHNHKVASYHLGACRPARLPLTRDQIFHGLRGRSFSFTSKSDSASSTALAIAGKTGMDGPSPTALLPVAVNGDGYSRCPTSMFGVSAAVFFRYSAKVAVIICPSLFQTISSPRAADMMWATWPCICPSTTAGLIKTPASCVTTYLNIDTLPVSMSTSRTAMCTWLP